MWFKWMERFKSIFALRTFANTFALLCVEKISKRKGTPGPRSYPLLGIKESCEDS